MAHVAKYQASACGGMCAHYDREPERERGYRRENIDPARTALNYNLAPAREDGQVAFINQRIASLGLKRAPRKDAVRMCDCVVTMPKTLDPARGREFFERAYGFLCGRYGAANVVSAYVHMDETRPHMHFAWVPVTPDGRLSAKDVVSRKDLRTLHGDMQRSLEESMGCRVDLLLDPEQQGEKQLSHLGQAEYRAARDEAVRATERAAAAEDARKVAEGAQRAAEDAQRAAEERLECLQRGVSDAESMAKEGVAGLRRVAREGGWAGGREQAARSRNQELRARADALEGEGRELGGRCESLEAEKAGSPAAIQDLERDVRRLGGRVRELRQERYELAGRVRELERDRDGLERRVAELRGHVQAAWRKLVTRARAFRGWLRVPRELEWVCRDLADCVEGFRRADDRCWGSDGRAPQRDATLHPSPDDLIRQARADVMADERTQPQRRRGFGRAR